MRLLAFCTSLVALVGLISCSGTTSPNIKAQESVITDLTKTGVKSVRAGPQEQVNPYETFTRALIDQSEVPVLLVSIPDRASYGTLFPAASNGGVDTWRTGDNVSMSFARGVIVASRGLGGDLMASDPRDVIAGVARANGEGVRIHDYLDGEDQTVRMSLYCTYASMGPDTITLFELTYTLNRVVETCKTPTRTIENEYWGGTKAGQYRQSRQWLGPDVGYILLQKITR